MPNLFRRVRGTHPLRVAMIDINPIGNMMIERTAAENRRLIEAKCIVSDIQESRRLWKEQFLTKSGHKKAWEKVWTIDDDGMVTKAPTIVDVPVVSKPSQVVRTVEAVKTLPEILYVGNQVHNAFTIQQVKGGWCVAVYEVDGKVHTVTKLTEPEGKQFALNRLLNFVRMDIRGK